jgi:hypothetical protein
MLKTVLCWNLNRRPLAPLIRAAAKQHQVDVLILLECEMPIAEVLLALNGAGDFQFHYASDPVTTSETRIHIFTRFAPDFCRSVSQGRRFTIRHIQLPLHTDFILAAVHFPSKLYWGDDSQQQECTAIARDIAEGEGRVGHSRTILVGDLNMNPFEPGVVGAAGLNATMVRQEARRGSRQVSGRTYSFFHNPMWGHFGDGVERPAGTYYYDAPGHVSYYWNMFDQVLVRPSLLDQFRNESLRILDRIGEESLLTGSGRPNKTLASDHLPLLFSLDL